MKDRLAPLRPFWLLMPLGFLYLASFYRLVQLHCFPTADAMSLAQHLVSAHEQEPPRGRLLDRRSQVLATDRPMRRLVIDAMPDTRREPSLERLSGVAELLDLTAAEIFDHCISNRTRSVIADGLSAEMARRLQLVLQAPHESGYPLRTAGFRIEKYWDRVRPQGRSLAQAVGVVQTVEDPDLPPRIGGSGLESLCDDELQGVVGRSTAQLVSASYGINPMLSTEPPRQGGDVRTTLDARIGLIARNSVAETVEAWGAEWGAYVVLDPRNGELLAIGAYPDFDPSEGIDDLEQLTLHPLSSQIEPGSTVKPFVIAAALTEQVITPGTTVFAENGRWSDRGRTITDTKKDGWLDARGILERSSNIAISKVGHMMGHDLVRRSFLKFGFDDPLGLLPGEAPPSKLPPRKGSSGWSNEVWTLRSVCFGHQFRLTPARLAYSFASVVNGGRLYPPRLLRDTPHQAARRVMPSWVSEYVRESLEAVVTSAPPGRLPERDDFDWGGKSGTTKKTHVENNYTSSFVGFGPLEEPELLVVVVVENPTQRLYGPYPAGRSVAGPAVGQILEETMVLRGRLPAE